jgi:bifunctional non-homologous end joining protein LigD
LEPYEGGPYITDGEVAVLDDIGRSDFNRLQDRALRRGPCGEPVIYCMFDLLHAGRTSLLEVPLALRKSLLVALFDPKPTHDLLVVESVPETGLQLYAAAVQLKLEGLVAKQCDSPYLPGKRSSVEEAEAAWHSSTRAVQAFLRSTGFTPAALLLLEF